MCKVNDIQSRDSLKYSTSDPRRTVDVRAEVDLADVIILQDGGISGVGSVVGGAVVEGAAGGEGQAGIQTVLLYQLTGAVLQPLAGGEKRKQHILIQRKFTQNAGGQVQHNMTLMVFSLWGKLKSF